MKGFTYLLTDGIAYKIGHTTRDVEQRVAELNRETSSYGHIEALAFAEVKDSYALERYPHQRFADKRIKNEWFKLGNDDLVEIQGVLAGNAVGKFKAPLSKKYQDLLAKRKKAEAERAKELRIQEIAENKKRRAEIKEEVKEIEYMESTKNKRDWSRFFKVLPVLMFGAMFADGFDMFAKEPVASLVVFAFLMAIPSAIVTGLWTIMADPNYFNMREAKVAEHNQLIARYNHLIKEI